MESSLTDREEIIEVQDAEVKGEELELSQPFAIIEDIPVFFLVMKMYPKKIMRIFPEENQQTYCQKLQDTLRLYMR